MFLDYVYMIDDVCFIFINRGWMDLKLIENKIGIKLYWIIISNRLKFF